MWSPDRPRWGADYREYRQERRDRRPEPPIDLRREAACALARWQSQIRMENAFSTLAKMQSGLQQEWG